MRILLACPYDWGAPGGVQVHVRELARRLTEGGQEVAVVAPARRPPGESWVHVVASPIRIPYNASVAPIDPRPWSMRRVRRVIGAFAPHVVHVHEPLTPSTSMWVTLVSNVPVVATFHSGATRSRLYDLAAPVLRRIAGRIAVRVAVSSTAERFAAARIGGTFEIVPNGVDVARFRDAPPADLGPGTKLLFVGRLDPRKGFPIAMAAFRELADDRADLRLIVVGDGPERGAVQTLPHEMRERVRFLGSVPNDRLPPIHAACDVYLGTSVGGESFGVVLVEAMAAGLPVVASDIAGYDEVLEDGVQGLRVPPRDPALVAAAVARILDDPSLASRMGEAGRERAIEFSWERIAPRLTSLYERAIATTGG